MQSGLTQTEVEFLELLVAGETVEIFDHRGNVHCRGTVEEVAPELGVAWIRTDMCERKLLDIREHSVRRFSRPDLYYLEPNELVRDAVLAETGLPIPGPGLELAAPIASERLQNLVELARTVCGQSVTAINIIT